MKKDDLKEMMRNTIQKGKSMVAVEMDDVEEFMDGSDVVDGNRVKGDAESWIAMMAEDIRRLKAANVGVTFRNVLFIVKSRDCAFSMDELDKVCEKLGEAMNVQEATWGLMADDSMNEHEVEVSFLIGD